MSKTDRQRWDRRYSCADHRPSSEPARFLIESLPLIPIGKALVVACGLGRNALALAESGFQVDAFDISAVAIERAKEASDQRELDVNWRIVDLDQVELEIGAYDLITVFRYVNRPLWPRLVEALAPNGWLTMEIHLRTSTEVSGPQSDGFRVAPQEVLRAFDQLRIVSYEESIEPSGAEGEAVALARLLACNGEPGW